MMMRSYFSTSFLLLLSLVMLLSGCNYPCIGFDDFNQYDKSQTIEIEADGNYTGRTSTASARQTAKDPQGPWGQWLDTGMVLRSNQRLKIEAVGQVYMCPWDMVYDVSTPYSREVHDPLTGKVIDYIPGNITLRPVQLNYQVNSRVYPPQYIATNGGSYTLNKGDLISLKWGPINTSFNDHRRNQVRRCGRGGLLGKSCRCNPYEGGNNTCMLPFIGDPRIEYFTNNNPNYFIPRDDYRTEYNYVVGMNPLCSVSGQRIVCPKGQSDFDSRSVSGILGFQVIDSSSSRYGDNVGGFDMTVKLFNKRDCFVNESDSRAGVVGALEFIVVPFGAQGSDGKPADPNKPSGFTVPDPQKTGPIYTVENGIFDNNPGAPVDISASSANNRPQGGTFSGSGKIWMRVKPNANHTEANRKHYKGQYNVVITSFKNPRTLSKVEEWAVKPVKDKLLLVTANLFHRFINNSDFLGILRALITIYIMVYAIAFMFGMVRDTQMELVKRAAKVAVVLALIPGPDYLGQVTNVWAFFYNNMFIAFDKGTDFLIRYGTGGDPSVGSAFGFVDFTIGQMFSSPTWKKIASLLFAFPVGAVYFCIIVYCFIRFLLSMLEALIVYLICMIGVAFLTSLAPLFIAFILFERTRAIFDEWIKHMFFFMINPVIVFIGLGFLNALLLVIVEKLVSFTVCWSCVLDLHILVGSLKIPMPFCFKFYYPSTGVNIITFLVELLPLIISLLLITMFAVKFLLFSSQLSSRLIGSPMSSSLGGAQVAQQIGQKLSGAISSAASFVSKKNK